MALPAAIIVPVLQILSQMRQSQNAAIVAVQRNKLAAHIRQMEIEVEKERIHAQKEILNKILDSARHVFDRKMDLVQESLRATQSLIASHHSLLLNEHAKLCDEREKCRDETRLSMITARVANIDDDLIELERLSSSVAQAGAQAASYLGNEFRVPNSYIGARQ